MKKLFLIICFLRQKNRTRSLSEKHTEALGSIRRTLLTPSNDAVIKTKILLERRGACRDRGRYSPTTTSPHLWKTDRRLEALGSSRPNPRWSQIHRTCDVLPEPERNAALITFPSLPGAGKPPNPAQHPPCLAP